jgi:hypothetical protein
VSGSRQEPIARLILAILLSLRCDVQIEIGMLFPHSIQTSAGSREKLAAPV